MKQDKSKYEGELAKPIVLDPYFAIAMSIVGKEGAQPDKKEKTLQRRRDRWILRARIQKVEQISWRSFRW
jgi:hypothetical protein